MAAPKEEEDIEEEIEEHLSIDENFSLDDEFDIKLNSNSLNLDGDNAANRKRKLFEFDDDDIPDPSVGKTCSELSKFKNFDDSDLDDLLSGNKLVQHFTIETDEKEKHENQTSNNSIKIEDQPIQSEQYSFTHEETDENSNKTNTAVEHEKSRDDIILINDQRVSINSLKHLQASQENNVNSNNQENSTNQSTTNDISDILCDENPTTSKRNLTMRQTKSVDLVKTPIVQSNLSDRNFHSLENLLEFQENRKIDGKDILINVTHDLIQPDELSSLGSNIDINNETEINKILDETKINENRTMTPLSEKSSISYDDLKNLKEKIYSHSSNSQKSSQKLEEKGRQIDEKFKEVSECVEDSKKTVVIKPLEVLEHSKDALDDISEESEHTLQSNNLSDASKLLIEKGSEFRQILERSHDILSKPTSTEEKQVFNPFSSFLNTEHESVANLSTLQIMENKIKDLTDIIAGKDICLAALNMQLEGYSIKESLKDNRDSLKELPSSGRASSSLTNSSTEYRTIPDEYVNKIFDFQNELTERDHLIEQLTESLQQSMNMREDLHNQAEKLTNEVTQLRKQLSETLETVKKSHWARDQESVGQRISEISIDLVSETDEESDKNENAENDSSRSSRERYLDDLYDQQLFPNLSKEIQQFLKFLSPDEVRIFNMVQKKFDEYFNQELENVKTKYEGEVKILTDRYESDKNEKDNETARLRQLLSSVKSGSTAVDELRHELETRHSLEMENLRTYFERKCTELEKQYSEEIYSQQSRRISNDSGSELSDQDNLPEEEYDEIKKVEEACMKKNKNDLYSSPTHRKLTPTTIGTPNKKKRTPTRTRYEEIEKLKPSRKSLEKFDIYHPGSIEKLEGDEYISVVAENVESNLTEQHEFNQIIIEYERRLQEQVTLARQDVLNELDIQIKTLLTDTTTEDSHWPPELILLREKFTAKSQLEIAQLQIKHEEEMSRIKSEYDKQLNRKLKRHTTFDSSRDLDEIVIERNNLRELSNTLRWLLSELAKYCSICEEDLNNSLCEELIKHGVKPGEKQIENNVLNTSTQTVKSTTVRNKLDVSGILSIIEEPSFIEFVSNNENSLTDFRLNINECLEKLNSEALYLLKLTEDLAKDNNIDKIDSCEEEDGLKKNNNLDKLIKAKSLNESALSNGNSSSSFESNERITKSLPISTTKRLFRENSFFNENELKNRLEKLEDEKKVLVEELGKTVNKNDNLMIKLNSAKQKIEHLEGQKEMFMESFGANLMSPRHQLTIPKTVSVIELQERAKTLLNQTHSQSNDNTNLLLQLVEDFCRESDRFMEENKKDKDDLQSQIDAADKQLKATRNFLEDQAAEREIERDDFTKEIENLRNQLKERDKEKNSHERVVKEMETLENQIKELNGIITDYEDKKSKLENDLKESIDKIFVLREIITELESQIETRNLNEHVLLIKVNELEGFIENQNQFTESLQNEIKTLKTDVDVQGYNEKIISLEEKLKKSINSVEQNQALEQMTEHLRDIETVLEKKTKTLESLHSAICSASCSSPSEDVSVQNNEFQINEIPSTCTSLPIDEIQRIIEKLNKHSRAEEAAIKRIKDLEMQFGGVRNSHEELQNERDLLQEKLSEQMLKISSLQSRLDEQRHRSEEMHRQGTSSLNLKVHDLMAELTELKEILSSRDKQISNLKSHLEESKKLIDRQESELVQINHQTQNEKYENELRQKNDEISRLNGKIKNEMINKLALPDLMETMLADKNDELDLLKEKLDKKEEELKVYLDLNLDENQLKELQRTAKELMEGKTSARTLSDIVSISSEYDDVDLIRKCAESQQDNLSFNAHEGIGKIQQLEPIPYKRSTNEVTLFGMPNTNFLSGIAQSGFFQDLSSYQKDALSISPEFEPRKLQYSPLFETSNNSPQAPQSFGNVNLSDILEEEHDIDKLRDHIDKLNEKLKLLPKLESEVESLKMSLESVTNEKNYSIDSIKTELKLKIKEISNLQIELSGKTKLYEEILNDKKLLENEIEEMKFEINKMEKDIKAKENDIKCYLMKLEELQEDHDRYQQTTKNDDLVYQIETFKQQIELLNKAISRKDDIISKFEKDFIDYSATEKLNLERIKSLESKISEIELNRLNKSRDSSISNDNDNVNHMKKEINNLREELYETRHELSDKMIGHEKNLLDLQQKDEELKTLKNILSNLKDPQNPENNLNYNQLKEKLSKEITKNNELRNEIEKLKTELERNGNSSSPKPFSLDELAKQVENELNYSAQLDSNILKAIESDDLNSDFEIENEDKRKTNECVQQSGHYDRTVSELKQNLEIEKNKNRDLINKHNELMKDFDSLRYQLETERLNCTRLQNLLDSEKKNSNSIQQQDANIIEAMRIRLEAAIENENDLQQKLDQERSKTEQLVTQMSSLQRTLATTTSSPRKSMDHENVSRLESELLFLTAQNEREKERVMDLQRVLERERHRFDKEIGERKEFADRMKKEVDRVLKENDFLQKELEHSNEKFQLANREIESLESRLTLFESNLSDKVVDRREIIESRKLREKLRELEKEKNNLNETIYLLRGDVERGAQRESKLADALAKEANGEGPVPQLFLQKLKETNDLLLENAKENRQMADTLQFLTEERRTLQNRIADMESNAGVIHSPKNDLEERANHLFGKYLKSESFRKALVHQKRYLLLVITAFEQNEAKALDIVNPERRKKRKSFRSVVFALISITRMKFIVNRWHRGKRIGAKAIFTSQILPRRSASATTNYWTKGELKLPNSPPSRDRIQTIDIKINNKLSNFTPTVGTSSSSSNSNIYRKTLQSPELAAEQMNMKKDLKKYFK